MALLLHRNRSAGWQNVLVMCKREPFPRLQPVSLPTVQHLCYCGEKLKGRYTLAKHWHGLMRQVSALGDIVLQVDKVDQQPLAGAVSWGGRAQGAVRATALRCTKRVGTAAGAARGGVRRACS